MDLKAAYDNDARAGKLTRAGMGLCFFVTGAILVATLAFAKPSPQGFDALILQASLLR